MSDKWGEQAKHSSGTVEQEQLVAHRRCGGSQEMWRLTGDVVAHRRCGGSHMRSHRRFDGVQNMCSL